MEDVLEYLEIAVLIAREIADDVCSEVPDHERSKCVYIVRKLAWGYRCKEEIERLSEETRVAMARKLRDLGISMRS